MTSYVVGFLFDILGLTGPGPRVLLIQKKRPTWQLGLLNGVGGKIEEGEDPLGAMRREFTEETGQAVITWTKFATGEYRSASTVVHFFRSFQDLTGEVRNMTDEELVWKPLPVRAHNLVYNLPYLIPMALDPLLIHAKLSE